MLVYVNSERGSMTPAPPDWRIDIRRMRGQVSAEIYFSSNIRRRGIDSRAKRRYSLAQIPNLVAYTNARSILAASIYGLARLRARPDPQQPAGAPAPETPVEFSHTIFCTRSAPAQSDRGSDHFVCRSAP